MSRLPQPGTLSTLISSGLLALAALAFRHPLEATMARHMLLQMPMLLAAGALLGVGVGVGRLHEFDENGITGLFAAILAIAFWMIPKALDSAVVSATMDSAKFSSLLLTGLLLPASLARANTVIQLFFVGNFAFMAAIAGMLYQDSPSRLCNLYLFDDQVTTGTGVVALAIAVPLAWGMRQLARTQPEPAAQLPLSFPDTSNTPTATPPAAHGNSGPDRRCRTRS